MSSRRTDRKHYRAFERDYFDIVEPEEGDEQDELEKADLEFLGEEFDTSVRSKDGTGEAGSSQEGSRDMAGAKGSSRGEASGGETWRI